MASYQRKGRDYYYTYHLKGKIVISAIRIPSIPALNFSTVKDKLIIPFLNSKGISGYTGLTYERAKNAIGVTPVPAYTITPVISLHGVNYDTLTGEIIVTNAMNETKMDRKASVLAEPSYVKNSFYAWLLEEKITKEPDSYISCMDEVTEYIFYNRIHSINLWLLTEFFQFKCVYIKVITHKQFKKTALYSSFVDTGQIFLKFLKNSPLFLNHVIPGQQKDNLIDDNNRYANYNQGQKAVELKTLHEKDWQQIFELYYNWLCCNVDQKTAAVYYFCIKNITLKYKNHWNKAQKTSLQPAEVINYFYKTLVSLTDYNTYNENAHNQYTKVFTKIIEFLGTNFELSHLTTSEGHEDTQKVISKEPKLTINTKPSSQNAIDPKTVIAWLVTQYNANGTLYLENVVRQYMSALRSAPAKLEIPVELDDRSVFFCNIPEELHAIWDIFKAAPNYNQVNISTSGMFSAGMSCYLRYLEHLKREGTIDFAPIEEREDRKLETDKGSMTFVDSANISKDTSTVINCVLAEKFTNGFRYSNGIELSRLRRLIKEQLGKDVTLDNDEIISYVKAQGTEYDGKLYVISKATKEHIYQLVEDYFRCGATAIFYAEFYAKHESWLFKASLVSEEMLNEVLRAHFRNYNFTQTYFGKINDSVYNVLRNEILRVWTNDVLLTYEALAERLVYIPMFRIEQHLGQNNDFIWNTKGEFTHISKIDIAEYEKHDIANYIESEIRNHGYASISDISLSEIFDRNYKLSTTAIHNAVYFICLADKYSKNGKIITRKGDNIDALHITKEYCKTLDRCTLDHLLDFERDLTGECHRWIPMQAGYDVLVRADENSFVAERYIHFDTAAIDTAIEYFLHGGEYIPLQSVTTFAMFPHCGQVWNLFLLESYCRRFSDDFRFECLSVNSKNAGAIVRKNSQLSYAAIMADAAAKSDIPLVTQSVLNFLVENGYISARRYTKVIELINQAKAIRNK